MGFKTKASPGRYRHIQLGDGSTIEIFWSDTSVTLVHHDIKTSSVATLKMSIDGHEKLIVSISYLNLINQFFSEMECEFPKYGEVILTLWSSQPEGGAFMGSNNKQMISQEEEHHGDDVETGKHEIDLEEKMNLLRYAQVALPRNILPKDDISVPKTRQISGKILEMKIEKRNQLLGCVRETLRQRKRLRGGERKRLSKRIQLLACVKKRMKKRGKLPECVWKRPKKRKNPSKPKKELHELRFQKTFKTKEEHKDIDISIPSWLFQFRPSSCTQLCTAYPIIGWQKHNCVTNNSMDDLRGEINDASVFSGEFSSSTSAVGSTPCNAIGENSGLNNLLPASSGNAELSPRNVTVDNVRGDQSIAVADRQVVRCFSEGNNIFLYTVERGNVRRNVQSCLEGPNRDGAISGERTSCIQLFSQSARSSSVLSEENLHDSNVLTERQLLTILDCVKRELCETKSDETGGSLLASSDLTTEILQGCTSWTLHQHLIKATLHQISFSRGRTLSQATHILVEWKSCGQNFGESRDSALGSSISSIESLRSSGPLLSSVPARTSRVSEQRAIQWQEQATCRNTHQEEIRNGDRNVETRCTTNRSYGRGEPVVDTKCYHVMFGSHESRSIAQILNESRNSALGESLHSLTDQHSIRQETLPRPDSTGNLRMDIVSQRREDARGTLQITAVCPPSESRRDLCSSQGTNPGKYNTNLIHGSGYTHGHLEFHSILTQSQNGSMWFEIQQCSRSVVQMVLSGESIRSESITDVRQRIPQKEKMTSLMGVVLKETFRTTTTSTKDSVKFQTEMMHPEVVNQLDQVLCGSQERHPIAQKLSESRDSALGESLQSLVDQQDVRRESFLKTDSIGFSRKIRAIQQQSEVKATQEIIAFCEASASPISTLDNLRSSNNTNSGRYKENLLYGYGCRHGHLEFRGNSIQSQNSSMSFEIRECSSSLAQMTLSSQSLAHIESTNRSDDIEMQRDMQQDTTHVEHIEFQNHSLQSHNDLEMESRTSASTLTLKETTGEIIALTNDLYDSNVLSGMLDGRSMNNESRDSSYSMASTRTSPRSLTKTNEHDVIQSHGELSVPYSSASHTYHSAVSEFPVDRDILLSHETSGEVQYAAESTPFHSIAHAFPSPDLSMSHNETVEENGINSFKVPQSYSNDLQTVDEIHLSINDSRNAAIRYGDFVQFDKLRCPSTAEDISDSVVDLPKQPYFVNDEDDGNSRDGTNNCCLFSDKHRLHIESNALVPSNGEEQTAGHSTQANIDATSGGNKCFGEIHESSDDYLTHQGFTLQPLRSFEGFNETEVTGINSNYVQTETNLSFHLDESTRFGTAVDNSGPDMRSSVQISSNLIDSNLDLCSLIDDDESFHLEINSDSLFGDGQSYLIGPNRSFAEVTGTAVDNSGPDMRSSVQISSNLIDSNLDLCSLIDDDENFHLEINSDSYLIGPNRSFPIPILNQEALIHFYQPIYDVTSTGIQYFGQIHDPTCATNFLVGDDGCHRRDESLAFGLRNGINNSDVLMGIERAPSEQINVSGFLRNYSNENSHLLHLRSDDLFDIRVPTQRVDVIVGTQATRNIPDIFVRHDSQNGDDGVPCRKTVYLNSRITLCERDNEEETKMFLRRNTHTTTDRGLILDRRVIGNFNNWDGKFKEELQFKRKRKLGEGSYGHVYLCETIETDKEPFTFAGKFIDKEKFNENEVLVPLRHGRPGGCKQCLQLYGVLVDRLKITVMMEFAEGGTLGDHIYHDPDFARKATKAKEMTYHLLLGLDDFHGNKIALYDIKPQNIAFRRVGDFSSVVYIDHGSAKDLDDTANRNYRNGTRQFYPPERHRQPDHPNLAAHDVWTLGCSVLSYVRGRYVDTRPDFNVADCMKDVQCPELEDLLRWMLHNDPDRRCTVQEALSHNVFDEIKQQEERRRRCF